MTIIWKQNEAPKPAGERNIFHAFKKQETKNFSPKLMGCK